MSEIIEYIDSNTALFSLDFEENFECYFLLLDSLSEWANQMSEYLLNLKKMLISKSKEPKNPFYFTCNTLNENLKFEAELKDKDMIKKICKMHFAEKTFLIQDNNNKNFFINFNLESILLNPNYSIIGIMLNPLEGLVKYFEENQNNLVIKKVSKYSDLQSK